MPSRNCPVCGARMLSYENPKRLLCPRFGKHHLYMNGKKLGKKGFASGGLGFDGKTPRRKKKK